MCLAIILTSVGADYCNEKDDRAPCAWKVHITNLLIHHHGRLVNVEFTESICNTTINTQHDREGKIPPPYKCVQLISKKTLYRDIADEPIRIPITYKAGCELRCASSRCL